jgi:hypothetical protein
MPRPLVNREALGRFNLAEAPTMKPASKTHSHAAPKSTEIMAHAIAFNAQNAPDDVRNRNRNIQFLGCITARHNIGRSMATLKAEYTMYNRRLAACAKKHNIAHP